MFCFHCILICLYLGSQARSPWATQGLFVRPTMLFSIFQIINIEVISAFTGVWKCSASEWTSSFQTNVEMTKMICP